MNDCEWGKCEICGKEGALQRTRFYYAVKCECHNHSHSEFVRHCENCAAVEPKETRLVISTEELKRITSHLAKQDDMQ